MNVVVKTELLKGIVAKAASVAKDRSPKPVLSCVLLIAERDSLEAIGSNIEIWVSAKCDCEVKSPGRIVLPAGRLQSWLSLVRGDSISVSVEKNSVKLKGERHSLSLPSECPDDFPAPPSIEGESWTIPGSAIVSAMKTRFAAGPDFKGFVLGAVVLDLIDGNRFATAMDGRSLVVQELGEGVGVDRRVMIPSAAAAIIARQFASEEACTIVDNTNVVYLSSDSVGVWARMMDGRYPTWKKMIPKNQPGAVCKVPCDLLENAARSVFMSADKVVVGADFKIRDGSLQLSASSNAIGESVTEIPVASSGEAKATLDPEYVTQFLSGIPGEQLVEVQFPGDASPCRLVAQDGLSCVISQIEYVNN